jgi:hypothetical protein
MWCIDLVTRNPAPEAIVTDMGTFRTDIQIENPADPGRRLTIYAAGTSTGDDVVFADPGDSVLLGARSLEGLNVRVDPLRKQLIDAGPAPAAAAA